MYDKMNEHEAQLLVEMMSIKARLKMLTTSKEVNELYNKYLDMEDRFRKWKPTFQDLNDMETVNFIDGLIKKVVELEDICHSVWVLKLMLEVPIDDEK